MERLPDTSDAAPTGYDYWAEAPDDLEDDTVAVTPEEMRAMIMANEARLQAEATGPAAEYDPFEGDERISYAELAELREEIGPTSGHVAVGSEVTPPAPFDQIDDPSEASTEAAQPSPEVLEAARDGYIASITEEATYQSLLKDYGIAELNADTMDEVAGDTMFEQRLISILRRRLDILKVFNTSKTTAGRKQLSAHAAPLMLRMRDILPCDRRSRFYNWSGETTPKAEKDTPMGKMPSQEWIVHLAKEKLLGHFDMAKTRHDPICAKVMESDDRYQPAIRITTGFHRVGADLLLGQTPQDIEFE